MNSILGPKLPILLREISAAKPETYIEIGCYRCDTMREVRTLRVPRIIGFDLFEDASQHYQDIHKSGAGTEDLPLEGPPISFDEAKAKGFEVYKGDTAETLLKLQELEIAGPVFVFLDGGHSFETVDFDWWTIHRSFPDATVVFDDSDYPGVAKVLRDIPDPWKTWLGYFLMRVRQ